MIHAKIDVKLHSHPKARKAKGAMATWTWALCYIRDHETDGFIPDASIGAAWVGETQARKDAATLVRVGLWEEVAIGSGPDGDGGWRLCKYADKNETRAEIDERRSADRTRKRSPIPSGIRTESDRNPSHPHEGSVVGIPGSGSGSVSESRSREPDPARATPEDRPSRPHNDAPPCATPTSLVDIADATSPPPAWWGSVCETVAVGCLGRQDALSAVECWLAYAGHRNVKGRRPERNDALSWLTTVMVPKARKAMRDAADRPQAQAPMTPYKLAPETRDEPTAEELAEVRRLAAKGVVFLVEPKTGTDE